MLVVRPVPYRTENKCTNIFIGTDYGIIDVASTIKPINIYDIVNFKYTYLSQSFAFVKTDLVNKNIQLEPAVEHEITENFVMCIEPATRKRPKVPDDTPSNSKRLNLGNAEDNLFQSGTNESPPPSPKNEAPTLPVVPPGTIPLSAPASSSSQSPGQLPLVPSNQAVGQIPQQLPIVPSNQAVAPVTQPNPIGVTNPAVGQTQQQLPIVPPNHVVAPVTQPNPIGVTNPVVGQTQQQPPIAPPNQMVGPPPPPPPPPASLFQTTPPKGSEQTWSSKESKAASVSQTASLSSSGVLNDIRTFAGKLKPVTINKKPNNPINPSLSKQVDKFASTPNLQDAMKAALAGRRSAVSTDDEEVNEDDNVWVDT